MEDKDELFQQYQDSMIELGLRSFKKAPIKKNKTIGLEFGIDLIDHAVINQKVKSVVGHKNNSLDVIMAEKPHKSIEWIRREALRVCEGGSHAVTITFTDDYLFKYKERYLMNEIEDLLKKTRGLTSYVFVNDRSSSGRFHLHGVVKFKDLKVITNLRRKLSQYGITKVKQIDNDEKWCGYMIEQYTVAGKHNIKCDVKDIMYIIKT